MHYRTFSLALAQILPKSVVVAMVSPLWSTVFLVFTSMMLLEKRLDNKFEGRPAYSTYKKQTPVLLPRLFSSFA
jgi:protein-S-isoprenylcysteine O-methyltransferase Ste14